MASAPRRRNNASSTLSSLDANWFSFVLYCWHCFSSKQILVIVAAPGPDNVSNRRSLELPTSPSVGTLGGTLIKDPCRLIGAL